MSSTEKLQQQMSRFKGAYPKKKLTCIISLIEILKILYVLPADAPQRAKLVPFLTQACKAVAAFKEVQELTKKPLAYEQGKEKALLAVLVPLAKTLHARAQQGKSSQPAATAAKPATAAKQSATAPTPSPPAPSPPAPSPPAKNSTSATIKKKLAEKEKPDLETLRERKMAIDEAIKEGKRCVEAKKIDDAQKAFRTAMNLHVDEDALYTMIAEIFHTNEVYKESFEFLRQALLADPNNRKACELLFAASEKSNVRRGELLLQKIRDKAGPSAHIEHGLAQFAFKARRYEEAQKHASLAVETDPGLYAAKDLLAKAEKKLKK